MFLLSHSNCLNTVLYNDNTKSMHPQRRTKEDRKRSFPTHTLAFIFSAVFLVILPSTRDMSPIILWRRMLHKVLED